MHDCHKELGSHTRRAILETRFHRLAAQPPLILTASMGLPVFGRARVILGLLNEVYSEYNSMKERNKKLKTVSCCNVYCNSIAIDIF